MRYPKPLSLSLFFLLITLFSYSQSLPDWALGPFVRPTDHPILAPDSTTRFYCPMNKKMIDWESNDVFNPAATIKKRKIIVLYRAEDKSGVGIGHRTSRIGYAESKNGIKMKRKSVPVLYPAEDGQKEMEWKGGCEDPRIAMAEDGTYVLMYTQWDNKVARLGVATSKDLLIWKKHGPAFKNAYNGKFLDTFSKSASLVTKIVKGKQVVTKVNGKYLMYWGEQWVNLATSTDLINWEPMLDAEGNLLQLIAPRKGYFDSDLTECGPPAIITDKGILLFYNGKNAGIDNGDKNYTLNSYCAGQVLFDLYNPTKVISRLDTPFFKPETSFEKSGQYPAGTVFIEGMVYFRKKWYLYYGCADSRVGVAILNTKKKK